RRLRRPPQRLRHLEAVHAGQAEVAHHHLRPPPPRLLHAGRPRPGDARLVPQQFQQHPQTVRRVLVVLDHQHARRPAGRAEGGAAPGTSAPPACCGSRTVKVAPRSLPSLWASTVPPCSSTNPLAIARPSPSPPVLRSRPWSACVNG